MVWNEFIEKLRLVGTKSIVIDLLGKQPLENYFIDKEISVINPNCDEAIVTVVKKIGTGNPEDWPRTKLSIHDITNITIM